MQYITENKILSQILSSDYFKEKPPVLIDVGASGGINPIWKNISKYSVCIAFEPDERDLLFSKEYKKKYKEFLLINRVVSSSEGKTKFYITEFPQCSSTLKPAFDNLSYYNLFNFFKVHEIKEFSTITIDKALEISGYRYIDWFKTDTQGTDLRIFLSIPNLIRDKVLVAEFEPGILKAYDGEDKLYEIMEYFDSKDFWCDECKVKGMSRIKISFIEKYFNNIEKRFFSLLQKPCAFWAEISYMNGMKSDMFDERDFLLMCAFSLLKKQYGFTIEIAEKAKSRFKNNQIYDEIIEYSIKKMKFDGYIRLPFYIAKKFFRKIIYSISEY